MSNPSPSAGAIRTQTQVERRTRTRAALLESAARGLSRCGYGNLVLEDVAREAGYTRGALYYQFKDKEDLSLAVIEWVNERWIREVGRPAERHSTPVDALMALARGHAVFCRRDIARVVMALRIEFGGRQHRLASEIDRINRAATKRVAGYVEGGRKDGSIPPGPPAGVVAQGFLAALEGTVIAMAGQMPHDEVMAVRVAAGVLGMKVV